VRHRRRGNDAWGLNTAATRPNAVSLVHQSHHMRPRQQEHSDAVNLWL